MEDNKKVLLKIVNLKKHFPLKKKFKGEQLFVKANDGITINIYKGETLGLVGESGCGKSTFGRVLLQLYPQTKGKTMYYGRSLASVAPKYVVKVSNKIENLRQKLKKNNEELDKLKEHIKTLEKKEDKIKVVAQIKELEKSIQVQILDIAQVFGGFLVVDEIEEVKGLYFEHCKLASFIKRNKKLLHEETIYLKFLTWKLGEVSEEKKAKIQSKMDVSKAKLDRLEALNTKLRGEFDDVTQKLNAIRETHKGNQEFAKYEEMRDDGIDLAKLTRSEIRELRKDLQLIFQDPYSSLNPRMTVSQIIGEGVKAHNFFHNGDETRQEYIMKVMEDCGLASYMIHRYPHQFSGGQRQRIGIARSLALKPKFVVCDEAVSALDVSIQSQVINLLKELKEKENLTYLFISHDLSVIKYISDRIGVMYLGNIVEIASSEQIFKNAYHPYTEALTLAIPTTDPDKKGAIVPLEGDIPSPVKPPKGCKFHTRCKYATSICSVVVPEMEEVGKDHFVACHHAIAIKNGEEIKDEIF